MTEWLKWTELNAWYINVRYKVCIFNIYILRITQFFNLKSKNKSSYSFLLPCVSLYLSVCLSFSSQAFESLSAWIVSICDSRLAPQLASSGLLFPGLHSHCSLMISVLSNPVNAALSSFYLRRSTLTLFLKRLLSSALLMLCRVCLVSSCPRLFVILLGLHLPALSVWTLLRVLTLIFWLSPSQPWFHLLLGVHCLKSDF